MLTEKAIQEDSPMEQRRIRISSKRQITIPSKYYKALNLSNEVNCIFTNNMLILTPPRNDEPAFAEEILEDLIKQGYSGQKLLNEFKHINRQIRPAIEKLIEEADALAKAASTNYIDQTDEIFGSNDEAES